MAKSGVWKIWGLKGVQKIFALFFFFLHQAPPKQVFVNGPLYKCKEPPLYKCKEPPLYKCKEPNKVFFPYSAIENEQ